MNYGSAITFEDKIYLIGGRNSSDTYTKKVLIYEDSASGWSEKSNLSGPARGNVTSLIFQNRIWVIGGSSANGYTNTVESYDLDSDSWSLEVPLPIGRNAPVSFEYKGKLFVGGGKFASSGQLTDSLISLNLDSSLWEQAGTLPEVKYSGDSTTLDGYHYILGGSTELGVSNKVFAADITPPMDLYYREANASGTITLDKLSTDLSVKFANSKSVNLPTGLVTTVDHNDNYPIDHTILERTDRNATTSGEMSPLSVGRTIGNAFTSINDNLIVVGGWKGPTSTYYKRWKSIIQN